MAHDERNAAVGISGRTRICMSGRLLQLRQRRERAYGFAYDHSSERADMLEYWIHHYNWHRPHQGIQGFAPINRLAQSQNNLLTLHT